MGTYDTQVVLVADESSFCEYASSPASATWTSKIPAVAVRFTPSQNRGTSGALQERANHSIPGYIDGPREGDLEIDVYWCGHNTAPTGVLTETWLQNLLANGLGGGNTTMVGGTCSGSGSTTSTPYSGATIYAGGIIRIGAEGDGRGGAQPVVVSNAASPATHLTAIGGAANAADVLYATQLAYPTETGHISQRFLVGFPTTGAQWLAQGCMLAGLTMRSDFGVLPMVTLRYRVAFWQRYATTVPYTGLSMETCNAAPSTGGSVFFQTVATTTRNTLTPSKVDLTIDMGLAEKVGPAGATYQRIVGFERTFARPMLTIDVPWDTAYETLWDTDGASTTVKHVLVGLNNNNAGRAVGFYLPDCYPIGPRPTFTNYNGLLYVTLQLQGREGPTTTNELTRSAFRLFSG